MADDFGPAAFAGGAATGVAGSGGSALSFMEGLTNPESVKVEQVPQTGAAMKFMEGLTDPQAVATETAQFHVQKSFQDRRPWTQVEPELKAMGLNPEPHRQDYQLAEAHAVQSQQPLSTSEAYRQYVPFGFLGDASGTKAYGQAKQRYAANQGTAEDAHTIAEYERIQRQLAGVKDSFAGKVVTGVGSLSGVAAEMGVGGAALGRVAQLSGRVGGTARALGFGANAAKPASTLGQIGQFAGNRAALTATAPSFFVEQARQTNVAAGRNPDDIRGYPTPVAMGVANNMVLGSFQKMKFLDAMPLIPGAAAKGVLGAGEAAGVEAAGGVADEFLKDAYKTNTKFGPLGKLAGIGQQQDVRGAALDFGATATTFALYAGMHGALERPELNRAKAQEALQKAVEAINSAKTPAEAAAKVAALARPEMPRPGDAGGMESPGQMRPGAPAGAPTDPAPAGAPKPVEPAKPATLADMSVEGLRAEVGKHETAWDASFDRQQKAKEALDASNEALLKDPSAENTKAHEAARLEASAARREGQGIKKRLNEARAELDTRPFGNSNVNGGLHLPEPESAQKPPQDAVAAPNEPGPVRPAEAEIAPPGPSEGQNRGEGAGLRLAPAVESLHHNGETQGRHAILDAAGNEVAHIVVRKSGGTLHVDWTGMKGAGAKDAVAKGAAGNRATRQILEQLAQAYPEQILVKFQPAEGRLHAGETRYIDLGKVREGMARRGQSVIPERPAPETPAKPGIIPKTKTDRIAAIRAKQASIAEARANAPAPGAPGGVSANRGKSVFPAPTPPPRDADVLTPKQAEVMAKRFGEGKTLEAIAAELGVSKQAIADHQKKALARLGQDINPNDPSQRIAQRVAAGQTTEMGDVQVSKLNDVRPVAEKHLQTEESIQAEATRLLKRLEKEPDYENRRDIEQNLALLEVAASRLAGRQQKAAPPPENISHEAGQAGAEKSSPEAGRTDAAPPDPAFNAGATPEGRRYGNGPKGRAGAFAAGDILKGIGRLLFGNRSADPNFIPDADPNPLNPRRLPDWQATTAAARTQLGSRDGTPMQVATTAHAWLKHVGDQAAHVWRTIVGSRPDPFTKGKDGRVTLANGSAEFLEDVIRKELQNPGSQPLTPDQRAAVSLWKDVRAKQLDQLEANGVKTFYDDAGNVIPYSALKNGDYFPRPAITRPAVLAGLAKLLGRRVPSGVPSLPGAKPFYRKGRVFETEEAGYAAGTRYKGFYDSIASFIRNTNREIADHHLANDPNLGGVSVTKAYFRALLAKNKSALNSLPKPERDKLVRQFAMLASQAANGNVFVAPAFNGKLYPPEAKAQIERMYGTKLGEAANLGSQITKELNGFTLSMDAGYLTLQLGKMMFSNPIRFARTAARLPEALFNSALVQKVVANDPASRQAMQEMSQVGGRFGSSPDVATPGTSLPERIPIVGKIYKATNQAFASIMDLAKIELWKANRPDDPSQWPRAVEAIENSLGQGRMEQLGMSPERAFLERLTLLAPSYYRSHLKLLQQATQGGAPGKIARQSLGALASGVLLTAIAGLHAAKRAGWITDDEMEERLDPARGKFLMVPIRLGTTGKSTEIGFGGVYVSMARTAGNAEAWHSGHQTNNPYVHWYRGHAGATPRLAWDVLTERDFQGNPIGPGKAAAHAVLPIAGQQALSSKGTNEQVAADVGAGLIGLRSHPQNESDLRAHGLRKFAADHGRDWSKMSIPEQALFSKQYDKIAPKPTKTPDEMLVSKEKAAAADVARAKRVTKQLSGQSQLTLKELGHELAPGYSGVMTIHGGGVPLSRDRQDQYEKLLAEEYDRTLAQVPKDRLKAADTKLREDLLKKWLGAAKERAEKRLLHSSFNR